MEIKITQLLSKNWLSCKFVSEFSSVCKNALVSLLVRNFYAVTKNVLCREIAKMLNIEFNEFCPTKEQANIDLYPADLRAKIDELNAWLYTDINNGVYKCGFAKQQVNIC